MFANCIMLCSTLGVAYGSEIDRRPLGVIMIDRRPLEEKSMEQDTHSVTDSFWDRPLQLKTPETRKLRRAAIFFWLWPVCYVVFSTVLGPVLFFSLGLWILDLQSTQGPGLPLWVMTMILVASSLVILIGNIVRSFRIRGEEDPLRCVRAMLVVRYGMIPFFILHACLTPIALFAIGFAGLVDFYRFGVIYLFAAPLLFMLPSAFYGIRAVRLSLLEKKLHPVAAVLHGIAQFIPVLGVLDAAYLSAIKWKTAGKITVVVLIAAILFLVLIIAWIYWDVLGLPWGSTYEFKNVFG